MELVNIITILLLLLKIVPDLLSNLLSQWRNKNDYSRNTLQTGRDHPRYLASTFLLKTGETKN